MFDSIPIVKLLMMMTTPMNMSNFGDPTTSRTLPRTPGWATRRSAGSWMISLMDARLYLGDLYAESKQT